LELAHSLDTDSCINALRRFIARRGKPETIRTDNGTNFVGSERELKKEIQRWNIDQINEFMIQRHSRYFLLHRRVLQDLHLTNEYSVHA
jgi:transposase InsO family protein